MHHPEASRVWSLSRKLSVTSGRRHLSEAGFVKRLWVPSCSILRHSLTHRSMASQKPMQITFKWTEPWPLWKSNQKPSKKKKQKKKQCLWNVCPYFCFLINIHDTGSSLEERRGSMILLVPSLVSAAFFDHQQGWVQAPIVSDKYSRSLPVEIIFGAAFGVLNQLGSWWFAFTNLHWVVGDQIAAESYLGVRGALQVDNVFYLFYFI